MSKWFSDYAPALYVYVLITCLVIVYLKHDLKATNTRAIIAGLLWPITAVLAIFIGSKDGK